jgi:hypothetical protein
MHNRDRSGDKGKECGCGAGKAGELMDNSDCLSYRRSSLKHASTICQIIKSCI